MPEDLNINYYEELIDYLREWLIKGNNIDNLRKNEKSRIKKCLELSNGHIILQQLIMNGANIFGLDYDNNYYSLKECESQFVERLFSYFDFTPQRLYSILPLIEYESWRYNNDYLYF